VEIFEGISLIGGSNFLTIVAEVGTGGLASPIVIPLDIAATAAGASLFAHGGFVWNKSIQNTKDTLQKIQSSGGGKGAGDFVKVNNETIINTATSPKKGGETVVGHALQKHAGRNPDIWGKVKGGPDQINQTALKHLKEIMDGPGGFIKIKSPKGIEFLEKKLPDGRGVRLNLDGTFKGFIDQ